jgi:hypothetical protein
MLIVQDFLLLEKKTENIKLGLVPAPGVSSRGWLEKWEAGGGGPLVETILQHGFMYILLMRTLVTSRKCAVRDGSRF